MTLCKFYAQGNCKYGNACRFEHPNSGNNRNQNNNPFGTPAGGANNVNRSIEGTLAKYNITLDVIERDLTVEAPQWILSAYAPGRDPPDQLFGGFPREQSFEEMRLHYWLAKASGNEQQALNEAQELYQNAKQQMDNAVSNPIEAAKFIVEGENRHPNRHDMCRELTQGAPFGVFLVGNTANQNNPFGGGATASTSAFGQPSTLGQRPNPFGQPPQNSSFDQPAQSNTGFGQPSQAASPFGQASQGQSAFGQPSQLGQTASAFGQTSALGAKPNPFGAPAFGQPSQPNAQGNPFGQSTAQNTQGSAFGQASQLGQKPNPFAATAGPGPGPGPGPSPFASTGNTNNTAAANPFASNNAGQGNPAPNPFASNPAGQNGDASPFAQAGQNQTSSPFGQPPSAPAANPFASTNQVGNTAPNPFAQTPASQPSPFGSQQSAPFGQQNNNSPFGQAQQNANPFGQTNGNSSQPNPFGTAQLAQPAAGATGPVNNPYGPDSTKRHPPLESYLSNGTFKGKPLTYKDGKPGLQNFDGAWARLWFPDGPPLYNKDTELPMSMYDDKSKDQWAKFTETGMFADGLMPELPPPRECTQWDF